MVINAFQQGQAFQEQLLNQRAARQVAEEQLKAQRQQTQARNALAQEFGPGAGDPNAFAALQGTKLRERGLNLSERQLTAQEQQFQQQATLNAALALDQAIDRGIDPADAFDRLAPILPRLGASQDDIVSLRQTITQNPAVVKDIIAALGETLGTRRQGGVPSELQTFNALTEGLTPEEIARARRVELGIASRAGQTRIVDVNGVPTLVDASANVGVPLNPEQVQQVQGTGAVAPAQLSAQAQPLSTQEATFAAAQREEEAKALGKETGKAAVERLATQLRPAADSGVESINVIDTLIDNVEAGIRTGSLAEARQEAARALATFTGADPSEATQNTDVFLATVGQQVAQNIRAFGAGTGLSDADREFARQMAGGNINASPEAILRILEINRKAAQRRIDKYNEARDAFVKRNPDFDDVFERLEAPSRNRQQDQGPVDFIYNPETGLLEPAQ